MSKDELLRKLDGEVTRAGSQKRFAQAHGISEQYLSDILKGRREPGDKLLSALGLRRVVTYEPTRVC